MKPDPLRSFWLRTAECCERYLLRPVPPTPFRVGMIVEVNYKYQGKVIKLHPNGTYDIRYPEGRVDRHVSETDLRDVKGDVSNLRIRSEEAAESGKHKERIEQILKLAKGTEGVLSARTSHNVRHIHAIINDAWALKESNNSVVCALTRPTCYYANITPFDAMHWFCFCAMPICSRAAGATSTACTFSTRTKHSCGNCFSSKVFCVVWPCTSSTIALLRQQAMLGCRRYVQINVRICQIHTREDATEGCMYLGTPSSQFWT